MDMVYESYLIEKWNEAEVICAKLGNSTNQVVGLIFDKLAQPYFYWKKEK